MQVSDMFILFQLVLLIFLSATLPFCHEQRSQPSPVARSPGGQSKPKKKLKFKRAKNEGKEDQFPEFVMPTESKMLMKLKEAEKDKQKKMKEGYFQENSDQDDTLENVESLRVEQSDRTRRAMAKKKKTTPS